MQIASTGRPLVVDFNYGAPNVFASRSDVSTAANLSVEEIIFRNQQAQAHQASLYTPVRTRRSS